MTPRILERELEAARLRATDDYKRDLTQAYNVARCYAMVRSKKGLPPLSELLDQVKDKAETLPQSPEQLLGMVQIMSGMYGIPMRRAKE
jgi:hypothetical protein